MRGGVPSDFDRDLWLDPLAFNGLIGAVLAQSRVGYSELFRADGFAKPKAELMADKRIAKLLATVTAARGGGRIVFDGGE